MYDDAKVGRRAKISNPRAARISTRIIVPSRSRLDLVALRRESETPTGETPLVIIAVIVLT